MNFLPQCLSLVKIFCKINGKVIIKTKIPLKQIGEGGGGPLSGWPLYPFTPFFLARNSKYVCWDLVTKIVEGKKWLVLKFIKENVNLHWMIDDTYWCTVS